MLLEWNISYCENYSNLAGKLSSSLKDNEVLTLSFLDCRVVCLLFLFLTYILKCHGSLSPDATERDY